MKEKKPRTPPPLTYVGGILNPKNIVQRNVKPAVPGYVGGTFVPADVRTVNPTPQPTKPPPTYPSIHQSPTAPIITQQTIPAPVIPPQAALRAAIMAGAPLPTGFFQPGAPPIPVAPLPNMIASPLGGGYMLPTYPQPGATLSEGPLEAVDEPPPPSLLRISATTTIPLAPPSPMIPAAPVVPPKLIDPVQAQIAAAIAAAQGGKI